MTVKNRFKLPKLDDFPPQESVEPSAEADILFLPN